MKIEHKIQKMIQKIVNEWENDFIEIHWCWHEKPRILSLIIDHPLYKERLTDHIQFTENEDGCINEVEFLLSYRLNELDKVIKVEYERSVQNE